MIATLERTDTSVARWPAAALAAIDALRGKFRGAVVTDDFGRTTQTSILTDRGAVVLTSWIADDAVPAPQHVLARLTVVRIAHELGLRRMVVRWFGPPTWVEDGEVTVHTVNASHPTFDAPAPEGHQRLLTGVTSPALPGTICLHVALEGHDLLRTIAHEMRHAQQLWGGLDVPNRERDAIAFAESWMERPR